jgi:hypothetical protein
MSLPDFLTINSAVQTYYSNTSTEGIAIWGQTSGSPNGTGSFSIDYNQVNGMNIYFTVIGCGGNGGNGVAARNNDDYGGGGGGGGNGFLIPAISPKISDAFAFEYSENPFEPSITVVVPPVYATLSGIWSFDVVIGYSSGSNSQTTTAVTLNTANSSNLFYNYISDYGGSNSPTWTSNSNFAFSTTSANGGVGSNGTLNNYAGSGGGGGGGGSGGTGTNLTSSCTLNNGEMTTIENFISGVSFLSGGSGGGGGGGNGGPGNVFSYIVGDTTYTVNFGGGGGGGGSSVSSNGTGGSPSGGNGSTNPGNYGNYNISTTQLIAGGGGGGGSATSNNGSYGGVASPGLVVLYWSPSNIPISN